MRTDERVVQAFRERYGATPDVLVRAPGRVNLIGEHTDYNDGFVMPLAIDRAAWIALRSRDDRAVSLHSLDFNEAITFELDHLEKADTGWAEYVKGMAWALQESGRRLSGWEGIVAGDVPIGAGLSSSAALELATARAFASVSALEWDPAQMALLGQRAENRWVGVNCGIMDQMISAVGRADHAVVIDCRSLEAQPVPFPHGTAVVVMDTATRRGLVDSAYNERRRQCEDAAGFFGVTALRDVSLEQFTEQGGVLPDLVRRRAGHVISENARVLAAVAAMKAGDARKLGQLLSASHTSLRDDFEVSSAELNRIVELAHKEPACFGARMTGAGFGGCALALVLAAGAAGFVDSVSARYEHATGLKPRLFVCQASDGAMAYPWPGPGKG